MVSGYSPTSLKEALDLRAEKSIKPYAGGTDIMVDEDRWREGEYLFLNRIPELKIVTEDEHYLRFGAGNTFSALLEHPLTPALLKEALSRIAGPAIRNEGTIGGNIANGSAKADSALIFFVTDSKLKLASREGERVIPIKDFYKGRKQLDMGENELLVEVQMPKAWLDNYYYQKIGARKSLAISRLGFAGLCNIQDGVVKHLATAYGAVSDVILRRPDIDGMLIGKTVAEAKALNAEFMAAYDEAIVPIRGRVSAEYRKQVCLNLLGDFLENFGLR